MRDTPKFRLLIWDLDADKYGYVYVCVCVFALISTGKELMSENGNYYDGVRFRVNF